MSWDRLMHLSVLIGVFMFGFGCSDDKNSKEVINEAANRDANAQVKINNLEKILKTGMSRTEAEHALVITHFDPLQLAGRVLIHYRCKQLPDKIVAVRYKADNDDVLRVYDWEVRNMQGDEQLFPIGD